MKTYSIPIIWECYKEYEAEAETLQEAATIAVRKFREEFKDSKENITYSVAIDHFDIKYSDESLNVNKIYNSE